MVQEDVDTLKQSILVQGIKYLKSIGFHCNNYTYEIKNFWLNQYNLSGSKRSVHSHYGFMVSGTYYVDVPAGSAPIVFHSPLETFNSAFPFDNSTQFNNYNSDTWRIFPSEGELLFFNSNLRHEVPIGETKQPRTSISFDITVKDYIG